MTRTAQKHNWLELSIIAFLIIAGVAYINYLHEQSYNMTDYKGGQSECRKEYLAE